MTYKYLSEQSVKQKVQRLTRTSQNFMYQKNYISNDWGKEFSINSAKTIGCMEENERGLDIAPCIHNKL